MREFVVGLENLVFGVFGVDGHFFSSLIVSRNYCVLSNAFKAKVCVFNMTSCNF